MKVVLAAQVGLVAVGLVLFAATLSVRRGRGDGIDVPTRAERARAGVG